MLSRIFTRKKRPGVETFSAARAHAILSSVQSRLALSPDEVVESGDNWDANNQSIALAIITEAAHRGEVVYSREVKGWQTGNFVISTGSLRRSLTTITFIPVGLSEVDEWEGMGIIRIQADVQSDAWDFLYEREFRVFRECPSEEKTTESYSKGFKSILSSEDMMVREALTNLYRQVVR